MRATKKGVQAVSLVGMEMLLSVAHFEAYLEALEERELGFESVLKEVNLLQVCLEFISVNILTKSQAEELMNGPMVGYGSNVKEGGNEHSVFIQYTERPRASEHETLGGIHTCTNTCTLELGVRHSSDWRHNLEPDTTHISKPGSSRIGGGARLCNGQFRYSAVFRQRKLGAWS